MGALGVGLMGVRGCTVRGDLGMEQGHMRENVVRIFGLTVISMMKIVQCQECLSVKPLGTH